VPLWLETTSSKASRTGSKPTSTTPSTMRTACRTARDPPSKGALEPGRQVRIAATFLLPYECRVDNTGEKYARAGWRAAVPLAVVLALVAPTVAACEKGPVASAVASSGAPAATSPSASTTQSPSPTTTSDKVLEGRTVMARRAGLSFEAPDGWQAVDPAMMMSAGAEAVPEFFEQLAKASGVSVEKLAEQLGKAADVLVMARPSRGFAANITVVRSPLLQLPEPEQLRAELEAVGATSIRVQDRDTPVGPARVVTATLRVGSMNVASRPIVVEHGGHVTTITVSTTDPARSDALVNEVIASLATL
jgi:hypothetical protein